MASSRAHPLEYLDRVDDAAPAEVALDENISDDVLAAELEPPASRDVRLSNRVLEEPEAYLGGAVVGEAVEAKVDDQVANVVVTGVDGVDVGGSIGVGDVIFVQRLARFPQPVGDVEVVLGATSLELVAW